MPDIPSQTLESEILELLIQIRDEIRRANQRPTEQAIPEARPEARTEGGVMEGDLLQMHPALEAALKQFQEAREELQREIAICMGASGAETDTDVDEKTTDANGGDGSGVPR